MEVLKAALEADGFTVKGRVTLEAGDAEVRVPFVASTGDVRVLVDVLTDRECTRDDCARLSDAVRMTGASRGLLVAMHGYNGPPPPENVALWQGAELWTHLGQGVLSLFARQSTAEVPPRLRIQPRAAPAAAAPAPPPAPGRDAALLTSGPVVKPTVPEAKAIEKARHAVGTPRAAVLELVPHHVFHCSARVKAGAEERPLETTLWVNAETGAILEPLKAEVVEHLTTSFKERPSAVPQAEAQRSIEQHLLKTLARSEVVAKERGEVTLMERIRYEPVPESIAVAGRGTIRVPRWRIEGERGVTVLDALD